MPLRLLLVLVLLLLLLLLMLLHEGLELRLALVELGSYSMLSLSIAKFTLGSESAQ